MRDWSKNLEERLHYYQQDFSAIAREQQISGNICSGVDHGSGSSVQDGAAGELVPVRVAEQHRRNYRVLGGATFALPGKQKGGPLATPGGRFVSATPIGP